MVWFGYESKFRIRYALANVGDEMCLVMVCAGYMSRLWCAGYLDVGVCPCIVKLHGADLSHPIDRPGPRMADHWVSGWDHPLVTMGSFKAHLGGTDWVWNWPCEASPVGLSRRGEHQPQKTGCGSSSSDFPKTQRYSSKGWTPRHAISILATYKILSTRPQIECFNRCTYMLALPRAGTGSLNHYQIRIQTFCDYPIR